MIWTKRTNYLWVKESHWQHEITKYLKSKSSAEVFEKEILAEGEKMRVERERV